MESANHLNIQYQQLIDKTKTPIHALITETSITKDNIGIKVDLREIVSRKTRFYIYQCGKEDQDDLGLVEIKRGQKSSVATIDLTEINKTSFEFALYAKEHDTNPISNKLTFTLANSIEEYKIETDETTECKYKHEYDSDDMYHNMYPAPQDIATQVTEQKQSKLELKIYFISCEEISCGKRFDPAATFFCTHPECVNDFSIYCANCMKFKHNNKSHQFNRNEPHIKCIKDCLEPNKTEFEHGKAKAMYTIMVQLNEVKKFIWYNKWPMTTGTVLSAACASYAGGCALSAITSSGASVVAGTIGSVVGGGAAGAVFGTVFETVFIWRQYALRKITKKQAFAMTGISLAGNAAAGIGFSGVIAIGAATGALGGPIGITVGITAGAIVAAILFGVGTRYGLMKWYAKKFNKQNDEKNDEELQRHALKYFFNNEMYDIDDENKFNDKILRKRYHRLALLVFPDRDGGDNEEWLKLSGYYGYLIGICELKYAKERNISSANDLSEIEQAKIANTEIKRSIVKNRPELKFQSL